MSAGTISRDRRLGHRRGGKLPTLAVAVAIALVSAFAIGTVSSAADAPSKEVVVKMKDWRPSYDPEAVTVAPGTTVEWVNTGHNVHTVTLIPNKAIKKTDAELPTGVKPFDSGFILPGKSWKYTFQVPGTYKYFCKPHESDGMVGEVVVK